MAHGTRPKRLGNHYSIKALQAAKAAAAPPDAHSLVRSIHWRPAKRGECAEAARPCPYVACKYHLALEITREGGLRFPHGHEPEDLAIMAETCALDVAEEGGRPAGEVAAYMGLSRQRTAQLESEALVKLEAAMAKDAPKQMFELMPILKRRFAQSPPK